MTNVEACKQKEEIQAKTAEGITSVVHTVFT